MIIRYSKHAAQQRIARGISKELIEKAIKRGATVRQTEGLLASYAYIKVAYIKKGNIIWVKTVMIK